MIEFISISMIIGGVIVAGINTFFSLPYFIAQKEAINNGRIPLSLRKEYILPHNYAPGYIVGSTGGFFSLFSGIFALADVLTKSFFSFLLVLIGISVSIVSSFLLQHLVKWINTGGRPDDVSLFPESEEENVDYTENAQQYMDDLIRGTNRITANRIASYWIGAISMLLFLVAETYVRGLN